ncbi:SH2 domain-containing adapter protein D [Spea bombifrons]|uniref:SH2 domain-containing adapter protein D n=1 Tax=Spea bombifrons TaxID=233779 RepID=UPI00234BBFC3|nr:SH2 domain-containing adapter protein D [Spea bombifrons]
MAKWFKEYLSFWNRRTPPQPPKPDYTESEIVRAYREQKSLDFEDPYEEKHNESVFHESIAVTDRLQGTTMSQRQRLIKVEQTENDRHRHTGQAEDGDMTSEVAVSNEYSDPFEVNNTEISNHKETENKSYMGPYKNLTPVGEKQKAELLLYRCPHEKKNWPTFHDSWQPSDDERPADEYDQPWEWKKENINRAFKVQFEGSSWKNNSHKYKDLQPSSWSLNPPQPHSPCFNPKFKEENESISQDTIHSLFGENQDTKLSLQREAWYHGEISREDAERLLCETDLGSFLLRTENDGVCYLSVRGCESILHVNVACVEDRFQLGDIGPSFPCIQDLIQYYLQSPLFVPGEGQVSLKCPVER